MKKLSEEHKRKIAEKSIFKKGHGFLGGCPAKGTHVSVGSEFKKGHKGHKAMLGKTFTKEHREKLSVSHMGHKKPVNAYSFKVGRELFKNEGKFNGVKRGWYDINGKKMFFRSKWEVNYALYLDWLLKNGEIKSWEYEKDVFIFEKIKFGTRSYRPDFKIFNNDGIFEYHEVKGWMDKKSATKLKRMRIYYPEIKMVLIEKDGYKDLVKKVGRLAGFI